MTRRRGAYLVGDGFTGNCSGSRAHVAYLPSLQDTIPHYRLHVLLARSPPRLPVLPQTFLMRYVRVKRLPQFFRFDDHSTCYFDYAPDPGQAQSCIACHQCGYRTHGSLLGIVTSKRFRLSLVGCTRQWVNMNRGHGALGDTGRVGAATNPFVHAADLTSPRRSVIGLTRPRRLLRTRVTEGGSGRLRTFVSKALFVRPFAERDDSQGAGPPAYFLRASGTRRLTYLRSVNDCQCGLAQYTGRWAVRLGPWVAILCAIARWCLPQAPDGTRFWALLCTASYTWGYDHSATFRAGIFSLRLNFLRIRRRESLGGSVSHLTVQLLPCMVRVRTTLRDALTEGRSQCQTTPMSDKKKHAVSPEHDRMATLSLEAESRYRAHPNSQDEAWAVSAQQLLHTMTCCERCTSGHTYSWASKLFPLYTGRGVFSLT
ncbi:hypothetical protein BD311DRAFT_795680 [Dichomitus squalens]|uniref:Uncharacterized protein n=1 Tax=Dichomitus squalens TaxID=114155 RepID=A0A4Q9MU07_9APHY|nr:hypothetical protein BD311DRAFT_795680 [Dichomitus squalens]